VAAALVLEVVHLLGDDVGALADALEDADVLEHRRLEQPVAEAPGHAGEGGEERLPPGRLGRQDVLGHGSPHARPWRPRVPEAQDRPEVLRTAPAS
jgi:hypothetical protein